MLSTLLLLGLSWVSSALLLTNERKSKVTVLVFGDSWGAWGPSWSMLDDMFSYHGVPALVKSTAVSGTRSCQWAANPLNLRDAVDLLFPDGPDFVWFTLGGNDLYDPNYQDCQIRAKTYEEAVKCALDQGDIIMKCNFALLDPLFEKYKEVKVVQCAYDYQCAQGTCLPMARWPYCAYNISCANRMGMSWQDRLLDNSNAYYAHLPGSYTGININGAMQGAAGLVGAKLGHPLIKEGAPCEWMTGCVHPTAGSPGAKVVGEAFWELFFKNHVQPSMAAVDPGEVPPRMQTPNEPVTQVDTEIAETRCNWDWVPDLGRDPLSKPRCMPTWTEDA